MLYEALTGRAPFAGNSVIGLFYAKLFRAPAAAHELVREVPLDLSRACTALLLPDLAAEGRRELAAGGSPEPRA